MYCGHCGKEMPDNSKLCNQCGSQISHIYPFYDFEAFDSARFVDAAHKKRRETAEENSIMEKAIAAGRAFLQNKKAVKRAATVTALLVFAVIAAYTIHHFHMEKITLAQIGEHMEKEEYEFAFDKINSGYISHKDMAKYRKLVVPSMQEAFAGAKKSKTESLSFTVDGTEYFFYEKESLASSYNDMYTCIYTMENDERTVVYEVPESERDLIGSSFTTTSYCLDPELCMYANGCLFFIEECSYRSSTNRTEFYTLKCLDLSTGTSKIMGSGEDPTGMYKLEDGSIFVTFDPRSKSVRYNPYTQAARKGENAATAEEIENAIYSAVK